MMYRQYLRILLNSKKKKIGLVLLILGLFFYNCLPSDLFQKPTSTLLYSADGHLLSAKIAADGQWRFPESDSVPHRFATSLIYFEDQYFKYHLGVNPISLFKALIKNTSSAAIKRGGSTITMQLMRMARGNRNRTYYQKLIEVIWAVRAELSYSKEEILSLYASHAPFGGNVVGLQAASWRYFNRPPHQLSWSESACLAVLPNAPSLIFPGKNQSLLLQKRNRLLEKLWQHEVLDTLSYQLALAEPLPQKPYPLPNTCYHLLQLAEKEGKKGTNVQTTIDKRIQNQCVHILNQESDFLKANGIMNGAVLVVNNRTKKIKAYVGNTNTKEEHAPQVDLIQAERSSGSILKPILYACMLDDGLLMPQQLVPDVPMNVAGYSPKNFDRQYRGAIPANQALSMSLNIPAVKMLQDYGYHRFYDVLKKSPLSSLHHSADHYGLSIILGGAETKLWDLVTLYAGIAGSLSDSLALQATALSYATAKSNHWDMGISHAALWHTMEAMRLLKRPESELGWEFFNNNTHIAWKTGTSFGFRDAWAIGFTPDYTVGVWIGNADGEGRPMLTGTSCAAPILFRVFDLLTKTDASFTKPLYQMEEMKVCQKSGQKANLYCENTSWQRVAKSCEKTTVCDYCKQIYVTQDHHYRVFQHCIHKEEMKKAVYFQLPPLQAWYYKKYMADYESLPSVLPHCESSDNRPMMEFIYPVSRQVVFLPKNLAGEREAIILKITHQKKDSELFWYLDNEFIGTTKTYHHKKVSPTIGEHTIMVVDAEGNTVKRIITIKG